MYKYLLFDFDGTLFKTDTIAVPAYRKVFSMLKENGLYKGEIPSEEEVKNVMGMTSEFIYNRLMPGSTNNEKNIVRNFVIQEEISLVKTGYGELYPHVYDTLSYLFYSNYIMYVASNGMLEYVKAISESMNIIGFLKKIYTSYDYNINKKDELVSMILEKENIPKNYAYMIGDRELDIIAGKSNNLKVIGCRYGYANKDELNDADIIIDNFNELCSLL
ncbi:HAD family hydrolase [Thermoanaerobacterium thermosaccharolyticum]|uniref:HAD family hydrolase n=1 Tax=Thermoanaerobacterium thermosaccharolyticum TaxID=1517 RepID=UPI003D2DD4F6